MSQHDQLISMKPAAVSAAASAAAAVTPYLPTVDVWTTFAAAMSGFAALAAGLYTLVKLYLLVRNNILTQQPVIAAQEPTVPGDV